MPKCQTLLRSVIVASHVVLPSLLAPEQSSGGNAADDSNRPQHVARNVGSARGQTREVAVAVLRSDLCDDASVQRLVTLIQTVPRSCSPKPTPQHNHHTGESRCATKSGFGFGIYQSLSILHAMPRPFCVCCSLSPPLATARRCKLHDNLMQAPTNVQPRTSDSDATPRRNNESLTRWTQRLA